MSFAPKYGVDVSCSSEIGEGYWYSTVNFIFHLILPRIVISDYSVLSF